MQDLYFTANMKWEKNGPCSHLLVQSVTTRQRGTMATQSTHVINFT